MAIMVCRNKRSRIPASERGMVLVVVLWIITLLAMMAGSFAYSMRTETTLSTYDVERAQARAFAEAGISYTMMHMLSKTAAEEWPADGSLREWRFGGGQLHIEVVDAGGKIDLNRADRALLGGLLTNVGGVAEEDLDILLDAIEDWRDPDDVPLLNGAEVDDYRAAGVAEPKNAPFESVDELQSVLGISPALYQRIANELTVYSNSDGLNPAVASASTLKSVPGIDPQLVDDYIVERSEAITQGLPAPQFAEAGAYLSQSRGLAYHIRIKVNTPSGVAISVSAVVSRERRQGNLYSIRTWREDV